MRSRLALHIAFVCATGVSCLSYAGTSATSSRAATMAACTDDFKLSPGLTEGWPRSDELPVNRADADVFMARPVIGRLFRADVMYRF